MKRILALIPLAATVVTLAFGQPAQDAVPHQSRMRGPEMMGLMKKLNLNDQQQEQFKKLRTDLERKRVQSDSKIQLARIDLRELMGADNPDRAQIEKKLKELTDLQHQQKLALVDHLFAARAILTPEQQKIWKEHMKTAGPELRGEMMQMRGFRGRRGRW